MVGDMVKYCVPLKHVVCIVLELWSILTAVATIRVPLSSYSSGRLSIVQKEPVCLYS